MLTCWIRSNISGESGSTLLLVLDCCWREAWSIINSSRNWDSNKCNRVAALFNLKFCSSDIYKFVFRMSFTHITYYAYLISAIPALHKWPIHLLNKGAITIPTSRNFFAWLRECSTTKVAIVVEGYHPNWRVIMVLMTLRVFIAKHGGPRTHIVRWIWWWLKTNKGALLFKIE